MPDKLPIIAMYKNRASYNCFKFTCKRAKKDKNNAHGSLLQLFPAHRRISDVVLFLTLGEALTLMGTVLTGLFGLIGCCRGLGRLLSEQEQAMIVSGFCYTLSKALFSKSPSSFQNGY